MYSVIRRNHENRLFSEVLAVYSHWECFTCFRCTSFISVHGSHFFWTTWDFTKDPSICDDLFRLQMTVLVAVFRVVIERSQLQKVLWNLNRKQILATRKIYLGKGNCSVRSSIQIQWFCFSRLLFVALFSKSGFDWSECDAWMPVRFEQKAFRRNIPHYFVISWFSVLDAIRTTEFVVCNFFPGNVYNITLLNYFCFLRCLSKTVRSWSTSSMLINCFSNCSVLGFSSLTFNFGKKKLTVFQ